MEMGLTAQQQGCHRLRLTGRPKNAPRVTLRNASPSEAGAAKCFTSRVFCMRWTASK